MTIIGFRDQSKEQALLRKREATAIRQQEADRVVVQCLRRGTYDLGDLLNCVFHAST